MVIKIKLKNVQNKRDYVNYLNERAASITARVMRDEIDYNSDQDRENYIESRESFQEAMSQLSDRCNDWSVGDVANIYEILDENYEATLEYVSDNIEMRDDLTPVESFEDYMAHCIAYDISKTVDEKISETLEDDTSAEVVEV